MLKKLSAIIFLFLLILPMAVSAQAAESSAVAKDILRFAPDLKIAEPITRDLLVAGGTIEIAEEVKGDVFVVGGTIIVNAPVAGDVRALGGKIIINSRVAGNIAAWAGELVIGEKSQVAGSVDAAAGKLVMAGDVLGDVNIQAGEVEISGNIAGTLTYAARAINPEINKDLIGGDLIFKQLKSQPKFSQFWLFLRLVALFGALVVGLVLVSIWPKSIRWAVGVSIANPVLDWLWGLGVLVLTPLIIVLLGLTIIGLPLALVLLALYLIAIYAAKILVGIVLGAYILGAIRGKHKINSIPLLLIMVIGVVVFWLIISIPIIGKIISLLGIIWGLGLIVKLKKYAIRRLEE